MTTVEFNYSGKNMIIQCNPSDRLENIIERFLSKTGLKFNSVSFLYGGFVMSNFGLTFHELANSDDRNRGKMNVLVTDACKNNDFSYRENKRPLIFETMDNLNKRFERNNIFNTIFNRLNKT